MSTFRTRIRELRENYGYKSQQSFADSFGVAQSTVGGWESGKREPNYETTLRLAQFFGVSVDYLLGRDDDPQKKPTRGEADELTEKDERDIEKRLEAMLASMDNDSGLMFSGEPLDDETRELLAESLRNSMRMARVIAKQKYTPKKYRPEGK